MFHKEAVGWRRVGLTMGTPVAVGTNQTLHDIVLVARTTAHSIRRRGTDPGGGARGFQLRTFVNGQKGF